MGSARPPGEPASMARALLTFWLVISGALCQEDRPIDYVIEEGVQVGQLLGNLIANTGMDAVVGFHEADILRFHIMEKPDFPVDYISIEETGGNVIVAAEIDREEICPQMAVCRLQYNVAVSPAQYFRIIKITVTVTDVNDNAPSFPSPDVDLYIPESTVSGTLFTLPSAVDLDGGEFGVQRHEFIPDTPGVFDMKVRAVGDGRSEIRLQLRQALDREVRDAYEIQVVVHDGGSPPLEGRLNVHVKVNDSNDNAPVFDPNTYEVTISESTLPGSSITRVRAHDADLGRNGNVRYSFSAQTRDDYGRTFGVNGQTGDVYVSDNLDYEERELYVLTVEAHDQGPGTLSAQTNVIVHIQDVNDKPPQVSVNTLTESGTPEVMEGAPANTFVAHLVVVDNDKGDGGTFRCEIRTDDFEIKKIAVDQYNIYSLKVFDREETPSFEFPIVCKDNGTPQLTEFYSMLVLVSDVNDNAPRFSLPYYSYDVIENLPAGALLAKINATDADAGRNARLRYSISGDVTDSLQIDQHTGEITIRHLLDYEETKSFDFTVTVEDDGVSPLSTSVNVHINVIDENDERPIFEQRRYELSVAENEHPGAFVGIIVARDRDSYPYNEFLYSFYPISSAAADVFQVEPRSGRITTRVGLDREVQASYTLRAVATSTQDENQSSECDIVINVTDTNDNPPVFQYPVVGENDTVHLYSQAPVGQSIAMLRAHDRDVNNNADLMYAIISGNSVNAFSIDSSSGEIYLFKDISSYSNRKYRLTVEVKDKGDPQLTDVSTLFVVIVNASAAPSVDKDSTAALLQSKTLTWVLAAIVGFLLVLILLSVAVIVYCRKQKRDILHDRSRQQRRDSKEGQKMLQVTGDSSSSSPDANGCHGNGDVTVIDMRGEKNGRPPLTQNGDESIPLTVDLLSNHPIVKVRLWTYSTSDQQLNSIEY